MHGAGEDARAQGDAGLHVGDQVAVGGQVDLTGPGAVGHLHHHRHQDHGHEPGRDEGGRLVQHQVEAVLL